MSGPGLEAFSALARRHRIVPVWREMVADTLTPVSAYLRVVGDQPGFLLESVEGSERWGRYSFVGRRSLAEVVARGRQARLTPKEFELLHYLVTHPNKALPHRELLQAVWGPDYGDQVEYLRVFINQLRKKIEPQPSKPRLLLTEPWVGYRFAMPEGG